MNLHTFLTEKNLGLYYPMGNSHVGWVPGMASEASVDMEEGEEDYPIYLLLGIKADDYVVVKADAEVTPADPKDGENYIFVTDIEGRHWFCKAYKILTLDEIFS
jgi:hypothetical protein